MTNEGNYYKVLQSNVGINFQQPTRITLAHFNNFFLASALFLYYWILNCEAHTTHRIWTVKLESVVSLPTCYTHTSWSLKSKLLTFSLTYSPSFVYVAAPPKNILKNFTYATTTNNEAYMSVFPPNLLWAPLLLGVLGRIVTNLRQT